MATEANVRLAVLAFSAAFTVTWVWRRLAAGVGSWCAALAMVAAVILTRRVEWHVVSTAETFAAGGWLLLAAVGAASILAVDERSSTWVGAGVVLSAVSVWAAVPETGPAVVVSGAAAAIVVASALTHRSLSGGAGAVLVASLGWAALSGAVGRPWAVVGGALCAGLAPGLLVLARPRLPSFPGGVVLLVVHASMCALAARWVAVDPLASWTRVGVLAAGVAASAVGARVVSSARRPHVHH